MKDGSSVRMGNQYGQTEEFYQCADCEDYSHRNIFHKSKKNRIIRLNAELTVIHKEVLRNLNSVHGAPLYRNRSIQAEAHLVKSRQIAAVNSSDEEAKNMHFYKFCGLVVVLICTNMI